MIAALVLGAVLSAPAAAFPEIADRFPRGLDFDVVDSGVPQEDRLVVARGGLKAPVLGLPLINRYTGELKVAPAADGTRVVIRYGANTLERPLEDFEGLLANAEALQYQRRKDYARASDGFSRALSLRPDFPEAAVNLACAYAMLGQADRALKAVRPLFRSQPLMLYRKIATDPELAALRGKREVESLKAPKPGTARWSAMTGALEGGLVAYSAARGALAAVAVVHQYTESAEAPETFRYRLRFLDAGSGRLLDEWPVDAAAEAGVNRVLADLGFDVPEQETVLSRPKAPESEPLTLARAGRTLELTGKPGDAERRLRVLGKGTESVTALPADPYVAVTPERLESAAYVPSLRAAVAFWGYFAGEGGGDWAYTAPVVVPLR